MQRIHKRVSAPVLVRVLEGILEEMSEDEKKVFCQSLLYTAEGLTAQINEYKEKRWWSAAKKRANALKDLEKIQNC